MSMPISTLQIAAALTGGPPLAFRQTEDGSLVVVAHTGQKFCFTPEQVEKARAEIAPPRPQPKKKTPLPARDGQAGSKPAK